MTVQEVVLHASCVSVGARAVLILGPSGSGKSALALHLMALGATLCADDRTHIIRTDDRLSAHAPPAIDGLIEARGIGIFSRGPTAPGTPWPNLVLVVDLGHKEVQRLPERHVHSILGVTLPCLHRVSGAHFAPTILLYLNGSLTGAS